MYARNIYFCLNSDMQSDYTRTFENQILLCSVSRRASRTKLLSRNPGSQDAVAIILWEPEQCRGLQHQHLPRSVKIPGKVHRWNAPVHRFETVISTFHNVPVAVSGLQTCRTGRRLIPPSRGDKGYPPIGDGGATVAGTPFGPGVPLRRSGRKCGDVMVIRGCRADTVWPGPHRKLPVLQDAGRTSFLRSSTSCIAVVRIHQISHRLSQGSCPVSRVSRHEAFTSCVRGV